jgi:cation transport ATPase
MRANFGRKCLGDSHPYWRRHSFDKGVRRFTLLMIQFILVMVPLVFLINGLTKHNWQEAFFFSLAVAVGLTPEMLPMIVSVCLSNGALAMSKKKVIVKRLNSIQDFGAMDVLCTDKTGTLNHRHHVHRNVAAVFAPCRIAGFHTFATPVLADTFPHAALLRSASLCQLMECRISIGV